MVRKANPKINWVRKPNTWAGKIGGVGKKYDFTDYLKRVGDFVETHPMSMEDLYKIRFAAHIWAYRHKCRIKTQLRHFPENRYGLLIEIINYKR